MSLRGWEKLTCTKMIFRAGTANVCGGERFVQVYGLNWHEGQGTTEKPEGYECLACRTAISSADMINAVKQKALQEKIDELQAEANG